MPSRPTSRRIAVAVLASTTTLAATSTAQARPATVTLKAMPGADAVVRLDVPSGWRLEPQRGTRWPVLTAGRGRTVRLVLCRLDRSERDMTGRLVASQHGGGPGARITDDVYASARRWPGVFVVAARGGGCVQVVGTRRSRRAARHVALRTTATLGPKAPALASDHDAERLALAARELTLSSPRATGTAVARPHTARTWVSAAWTWDLTTGYTHQDLRYSGASTGRDEVVRDSSGEDHVRTAPERCWAPTQPAENAGAFDPRLELRDWSAPPDSRRAWRVSYAPAERLPDGTMLVRWSAYVADGEAEIGPDGLLRRIRIADHRRAAGRTAWREVEIRFTAFPQSLTYVRPRPACA